MALTIIEWWNLLRSVHRYEGYILCQTSESSRYLWIMRRVDGEFVNFFHPLPISSSLFRLSWNLYSGTHSFVRCSSCNWSIKSMEQDLFLLSFHSMKRKKKNGFVCLFFSFLKICYSNLSMIHAIQVFFPLGFFSFPHTHDSVKPNLLSYSSENLFL